VTKCGEDIFTNCFAFPGDKIAYIYNDIKTAIVGKFERGILVRQKLLDGLLIDLKIRTQQWPVL